MPLPPSGMRIHATIPPGEGSFEGPVALRYWSGHMSVLERKRLDHIVLAAIAVVWNHSFKGALMVKHFRFRMRRDGLTRVTVEFAPGSITIAAVEEGVDLADTFGHFD